MKKIFIISAIMAVLGLTSCEKEMSRAIIGTWEATTVEMTLEGIDLTIDVKELGVGMTFIFKDDGTGSVSQKSDGESVSFDFRYSVEDGVLTIDSEGDVESIPVNIDGKNMTMIMDGSFLEDPGTTVKMHFTKK